MSRDGKGELIRTRVTGDKPISTSLMSCGGSVFNSPRGRYRTCSFGHVHCTECGEVAHRHGRNWTCGRCPGK